MGNTSWRTSRSSATKQVRAASSRRRRLRVPEALLGLIRRKSRDPTGDSVVAMTGERLG